MEPGAPDWQIFGRADPSAAARPTPGGGPVTPRRFPLPALLAAAVALALGVGSVGLALAGAPDGTLVIDGVEAPPADQPPASVPDASIVVDVAGAVVRPGVVRLPDGSRVGDALAAAGGFTPAADLAAASRTLNLATALTDGVQVRVPALADAGGAGSRTGPETGAAAADARLDLNSASAEALEALPGIGTVTAERIVAARAESPFASVDALRTRGLVGEATFARVRDLVRAGP